MSKPDTSDLIQTVSEAQTPEETRDAILAMGFNGLVFQRWYPETMDNWEGYLAKGFLEHYYAAQMYKTCPVAKAIHHCARDYTFAEARSENMVNDPDALRVKRLYDQFGMTDGIVLFTGRNDLRSAVILTTNYPAEQKFVEIGGALAFAARQLTRQLEPGNPLLTSISRDDPRMSSMQNKILQMQIDHPELSNAEMAVRLGMSPKTLQAHHKKIAKKTGVTTFAGAVIRHIRDSSSV